MDFQKHVPEGKVDNSDGTIRTKQTPSELYEMEWVEEKLCASFQLFKRCKTYTNHFQYGNGIQY